MEYNEEWKDIKGYEDYQISNLGRVKTKERKIRYVHAVTNEEHFRTSICRFLKVYHNNLTGYKFIQLYKHKKSKNFTIHRLVCESFKENPSNLQVVNHIDGNKHNNIISNLEWCTNEYNHKHATQTGLKAKGTNVSSSKLSDKDVYAIKVLLSAGVSHSDLARAFKISRPNISLISQGKTWKHININGKELTKK